MPEQRRALITGASRGIGAATAKLLADIGVEVVVAARDIDAAQAVADALPGAQAVRMDVADVRSVRQVADEVGAIDILVNNAGLLNDRDADPLTLDLALAGQALDTNALGAWRTTQVFAPEMAERGTGRIVNVWSSAGATSRGLWPAAPGYSVSKAALGAVTVLLADRLSGTGVLINASDPGIAATNMNPNSTRPPEVPAAGIAWLSTLPDDGPTGRVFFDRKEISW